MARPVGRIRIRLARKIEEEVRKHLPDCKCDPHDLLPAEGYWRKGVADVCRWEGIISVTTKHGTVRNCTVSSWDRMSECAKNLKIVLDSEDSVVTGMWPIEFAAG